jgi:hypothetical protein
MCVFVRVCVRACVFVCACVRARALCVCVCELPGKKYDTGPKGVFTAWQAKSCPV